MDKVSVLEYLAQVPDSAASDVADALGVSLHAAGMALVRLVRSGLASRTLDHERGTFSYSITQKGRERMHYLSREAR